MKLVFIYDDMHTCIIYSYYIFTSLMMTTGKKKDMLVRKLEEV